MQNYGFTHVKLSPREVRDNDQVRIGNMSPSLPAVRTSPAAVVDPGKVRVGNMSPSLPTTR